MFKEIIKKQDVQATEAVSEEVATLVDVLMAYGLTAKQAAVMVKVNFHNNLSEELLKAIVAYIQREAKKQEFQKSYEKIANVIEAARLQIKDKYESNERFRDYLDTFYNEQVFYHLRPEAGFNDMHADQYGARKLSGFLSWHSKARRVACNGHMLSEITSNRLIRLAYEAVCKSLGDICAAAKREYLNQDYDKPQLQANSVRDDGSLETAQRQWMECVESVEQTGKPKYQIAFGQWVEGLPEWDKRMVATDTQALMWASYRQNGFHWKIEGGKAVKVKGKPAPETGVLWLRHKLRERRMEAERAKCEEVVNAVEVEKESKTHFNERAWESQEFYDSNEGQPYVSLNEWRRRRDSVQAWKG